MKCVFKEIQCIHESRKVPSGHDNCRYCINVPNMSDSKDDNIEYRLLCAVSGFRDTDLNHSEYYGKLTRKNPAWFEKIISEPNNQRSYPLTTWFDHTRTCTNGFVIGEPYRCDMEGFRELIRFCDNNKLFFTVDGNSVHFSGKCFRIIVTKIKNPALKGS